MIKTVQDADAGDYFCQPTNYAGSLGKSEAIRVSVIDPPVFSQRPRREYWVSRFETFHVPCEAVGDPWPKTVIANKVR